MAENDRPIDDFSTGADVFESALSEFEQTAPEAAEPQTDKAPPDNLEGAKAFREGARRLGISDAEADALLPANLRTYEELEAARQDILGAVEYEREVNEQFAEMIREDMERIHQAREMSDLMDLRRELSDLNPGFGAKSEKEQTDLILGKARTDPRIMEAWDNRYSNPRAWQNAKDALAAWTNSVSPYYDAEVTADRMAVADAVRGRSGHRPERPEPSLGQMSDDEFNRHLADEYGF